jgi:hypothetical protein
VPLSPRIRIVEGRSAALSSASTSRARVRFLVLKWDFRPPRELAMRFARRG